MIKASIVCSLILFCASLGLAEVIDVNIKGVDDGIKTSKQQDYKEAVMNAKLQAIERAGASIESISKVVNFQLQYDAVESQSKGILLPGFQVIDIGYVTDGTYQVVLIGKLQVGSSVDKIRSEKRAAPLVHEIKRDGRFIAYNNGTVLDTKTNLMWASKDNGSNINWENAKSYCENYRGGAYTDWRIPTQDELAGLYDVSKSYKPECGYDAHLTELIRISCIWIWASETHDPRAATFIFSYGGRVWNLQPDVLGTRALPVRYNK